MASTAGTGRRLPGGLVEDDQRQRDWTFRPVSGELELGLAEIGEQASSMPDAVTRALSTALARLAGGPPTPQRVDALCVADRQFLMHELERHLGTEARWLQARCDACGTLFDLRVDYADLPVKEAGPGFPMARVESGGCSVDLRLPTGLDQQALAHMTEEEAAPWLLRQLAGLPAQADLPLDEQGLRDAEEALDAVAPAVVQQLQSRCPDCAHDQVVDLDPYMVLRRGSRGLLDEIHRIAWHYHWSEAEILALPRTRRRRYLDLIDRSRGMSS